MSYTITKRPMELADFLKVKKIKPYSEDRSNSKTVNFATIFACSGSALGAQMRQSGFSEEDCDKAAKAFGIVDTINLITKFIEDKKKADEALAIQNESYGRLLKKLNDLYLVIDELKIRVKVLEEKVDELELKERNREENQKELN